MLKRYKFFHLEMFNVKYKFAHLQPYEVKFLFSEKHIFHKQKRTAVYGHASVVLDVKSTREMMTRENGLETQINFLW